MEGIKTMTEKDIQLLKAIGNTGIITSDLLSQYKINRKRLYQHIISKNIEKKGNFLIFGTLKTVYTLTREGKAYLRNNFQINPYKSDFTQLEHDYVLARIYSFLPFECKNSWQNETKLKQLYDTATTTDGMFKNGSQNICVEVVTDAYTKDMVDSKKEFIRHFADNYIMIHTHKDIEYEI